jgi:E3 SUMO-protein ligase PIAS1
VDQVVIEPDGAWSSPNDADGAKLGGVTPATDDDDLIEITEPGNRPVKQEPMPSSVLLERTPAQSQPQSRETSTPSSAARMSSKKRSAAQVIDLTASDDEDDESPVPPPKRPALSFGVRGDGHQPVAGSPLHSRAYPPSY